MHPDDGHEGGWKRREFLWLGAAAVALGGCQSPAGAGGGARVVDAGPVANYQTDGVYASFRDAGFFLVRQDGHLIAISSFCTHRHCKLEADPDRSFSCPCHGSEFSAAGKVTQGPATRNLPVLATVTDGRGHLLVTVPA